MQSVFGSPLGCRVDPQPVIARSARHQLGLADWWIVGTHHRIRVHPRLKARQHVTICAEARGLGPLSASLRALLAVRKFFSPVQFRWMLGTVAADSWERHPAPGGLELRSAAWRLLLSKDIRHATPPAAARRPGRLHNVLRRWLPKLLWMPRLWSACGRLRLRLWSTRGLELRLRRRCLHDGWLLDRWRILNGRSPNRRLWLRRASLLRPANATRVHGIGRRGRHL